jgi:hypothetical protein
MNMEKPMGPANEDILGDNEAEMEQRLRAMVGEPEFFSTHVLDKSGNIVPKGDHSWDHA